MVDGNLSLKQRRFIEEYVGPARGNATEAARTAGYSDPEVSGWQNKQKVVIWAEIEKRLKERTLAADEILERLSQHANGTLEHFTRQTADGEVFLDLNSDAAREHFHLLKKAKTKRRSGGKPDDRWEEVEVEIELHDPQAALVQLGRYHKLWTERTEHAGAVTIASVSIDDLRNLSAEELARLHSQTLGDTK